MSYPVGSSVIYRQTLYTVEKFIPADKVPTKCKLQNLGPGYNLYVIRNTIQTSKSAFAWESELDKENKAVDEREETVTFGGV